MNKTSTTETATVTTYEIPVDDGGILTATIEAGSMTINYAGVEGGQQMRLPVELTPALTALLATVQAEVVAAPAGEE